MGFVVDGAKRMQNLVQDLLQFSRVGRAELVFEKSDFNLLVKDALGNLEKAVEESKAEIKFTNLPTIAVHKIQIIQLFQNLIGNSIKYRSKEVIPIVTISAKEMENNWEFSIKDNGIGISQEFY